MQYRVVTYGGASMFKKYFATYDSALSLFVRASKRLHPYGGIEIQEHINGAWVTVESEIGGAF